MKTYLILVIGGLILTVTNALAGVKTKTPSSEKMHNQVGYVKNSKKHTAQYRQKLSTEPHLRLQLEKDSIHTDDIYIGFDANAKTQYINNEDAPYFQGYGNISIASYSSDNVKLTINRLPFPQKAGFIKLYIDATQSGIYKLNMTEDVDIPPVYEVWLMDAYKKDSLDMRHNLTYTFNLNKADTNTFGSSRFRLVIRQNAALTVHLLDFTADKTSSGAKLAWKTENESNYTTFTTQRSVNAGISFVDLNTTTSDSLSVYNYIDKTPPLVQDEYRLKLTELDGSVIYSKPVFLAYGANTITNSIDVYPNPASGMVNFLINQATTPASTTQQSNSSSVSSPVLSYGMKIIGLNGKVIKSGSSIGQNWQTDISKLTPGTYIIQMIRNDNNSVVGKSTFVKL